MSVSERGTKSRCPSKTLRFDSIRSWFLPKLALIPHMSVGSRCLQNHTGLLICAHPFTKVHILRQDGVTSFPILWCGYSPKKTWRRTALTLACSSKTTPRSMMVVLSSSSNLDTICPCSCVNIAASDSFISGYNLATIHPRNMRRTV